MPAQRLTPEYREHWDELLEDFRKATSELISAINDLDMRDFMSLMGRNELRLDTKEVSLLINDEGDSP